MRLTQLYLGVGLLCLMGCDGNRTHADLQLAIADGVVTDSFASEFDRLYPNAEHSITYYTEEYGDPIWNSQVAIDGRTELVMQFNINIYKSGQAVTRTSTPQFHITTTKKTTTRSDGRISIKHGPGMNFGPDEWEKVVAAGGDLNSIIEMNW